MAELLGIYKCALCGNIIEVVNAGDGDLVCCGQNMEMLVPKTQDQGKEKHVPVIEKTDNGIVVKVGDVAHPMEENHYIQWIEIIADGKTYRQFLKPGDEPKACFCIDVDSVVAREHCSIHGLWKS